MKMNRVLIAAPCSGSGKTSVTVALLHNFIERGIRVFSVKAGPDYIDPLFHRVISGVDACNLDTYFTDEKTTCDLLKRDFENHDLAVMEGVMGLYDGVGGILKEGSSYLLAKETKTPILLVVNAKGAGKSLVAQIMGLKMYDTEGLIRGIFLNRVSEKYYQVLKPCIETETGIRVVGFLPEMKDVMLGSRHLGLVTPDEIDNIQRIVQILSDEVSKHADMDAIFEIAGHAEDFQDEEINEVAKKTDSAKDVDSAEKCVIAVSKDEAFQFLYEENLRLLKDLGAEIKFFSPIRDKSIPEDADALILCGGYPELYLEKLCGNRDMTESIRRQYEKHMPMVAECGGFLYLHKSISDMNGISYPGVGIVDADCRYTGKSVRFGYVEIKEKEPYFLANKNAIKGHEFHYYESDSNGSNCVAEKPFDHSRYECIHTNPYSWFGFAHLYYPSNPDFAKSFVRKALDYKKRKE